MSQEETRDKNQRVMEIEIEPDSEEVTDEDRITVFVVGSEFDQREAIERAAQLVADEGPDWFCGPGQGVVGSYCGSRSLDSAEHRQFIGKTQDDVIVGPEVPV